ncbi:MAG: CoA pyrophosphatase [Steroidobacteraceae bacterium]
MDGDAARLACNRVIERLAGTRPDHRPEHWRIGALQAPQAASLFASSMEALLLRAPQPAAVLVGMTSRQGDPGILLTVRAAHLRRHAGQISFPGGSIEPGDAGPAAAALREAQEEVGLEARDAEIVGFLPDQLLLSGYRVTPVVARIAGDFEPRYDPAEVQDSFVLPWSTLLDDASLGETVRRIAGREVMTQDIRYGSYRIWGATAGILLALRELVQE